VTGLAYRIDGPDQAPVLLVGPSLGTTLAMWDPQVERLARTYRVVRFDLPGHGASPGVAGPLSIGDLGRLVLGVADAVGAARLRYLGLSLGGMAGMWLAATHPDRVARLALVCTSAYLPPAQGWLTRAATVRAHGMAAVLDAVSARWFTPAFADTATVAATRAMMAGADPQGYAACCAAIAAMDLRPLLPRITAPTLVLAGAQDPATPPAHGAEIARAVPGARLVVLDNAAHLASIEQPAAVTALLADFLEER
jgi:3-oxoadipate enol-lactonase